MVSQVSVAMVTQSLCGPKPYESIGLLTGFAFLGEIVFKLQLRCFALNTHAWQWAMKQL
jgi:hypothetical protein